MNILSLFDGMSCGRIALERAGIPVTNYYASEIDKYAMKVSVANYPDIIQLGSVSELKNIDWRDQKIDLVIGGSPCQGFSFAGKQLNFDDPRSALFFEYVRILNEIREVNPEVKFLLENVKMKKEHLAIISDLLNVEPEKINSSRFSAQNRERYYWTNIKFDFPDFEKEIFLKDILDDIEDFDLKGYDRYVLNMNHEKGFSAGSNRLDYMKTKLYDKKKGRGLTYLSAELLNDTPSGLSRQVDRIYCISAKGPCLTKFDNRIKISNPVTKKIRYLSISEYEKMQTVAPGYTSCVTEKKGREMLGNGWTVDVIAHIFQGLKPLQ